MRPTHTDVTKSTTREDGGRMWLTCFGRRCEDGRSLHEVCPGICRRGRYRLFRFGGHVLAVRLQQQNCTVWNYHLGNVMFSSATFKRQCFPLASMSLPSNTRDRRISSVLTSRAHFKRFNIKRQRIEKQQVAPVLYGNNN